LVTALRVEMTRAARLHSFAHWNLLETRFAAVFNHTAKPLKNRFYFELILTTH
jgi:hypothetical protein